MLEAEAAVLFARRHLDSMLNKRRSWRWKYWLPAATRNGSRRCEGFHEEGHTITLGARRDDLEVAAKEIEADAIVCDNTDPAALAEVRHLFPHHLDTIVNIPAPRWTSGDPRAYSLSDLATAWRNSLDDTLLSAVLTLQTVGDHLRSGGSIISVVPENARRGAPRPRSRPPWRVGLPVRRRSSALAVSPSTPRAGRSAHPGYEGLPARRRRLLPRSPGCRCFSPPALPATSRDRRCTSAMAR